MKTEKSLNVLVFDDNKLNAEILIEFIKDNAMVDTLNVQSIYNVKSVLNEISSKDVKPNIVIINEPSHGKIKFLAEIYSHINKIHKAIPASKVIVLTSPSKVERVSENFYSGGIDVVIKDEQGPRNVVNSIHRFLRNQEERIVATDLKEQIMYHL